MQPGSALLKISPLVEMTAGYLEGLEKGATGQILVLVILSVRALCKVTKRAGLLMSAWALMLFH